MIMNGIRVFFLIGVLAIISGCRSSTYSRENIKADLASLAKKEYGLKMDVFEVNDTIIARYTLKNLQGELMAEDQKLWQDTDHLLMVLIRVTLSMDHPPKFFVLEIADEENPDIRFSFTRYVGDVKKYLAEAISTTQYYDTLLMEFIIGNEKKVFDPSEMDLVQFLLMALSAEDANGQEKLHFAPQEVWLPDFLAGVAANRARRLLKEKPEIKSNYFLRQVIGQFEEPAGEYRFLIDLVPKSPQNLPGSLLDKTVFPFVARETAELIKSYKFQDFSKILVTDKHTGRMMSFPR